MNLEMSRRETLMYKVWCLRMGGGWWVPVESVVTMFKPSKRDTLSYAQLSTFNTL